MPTYEYVCRHCGKELDVFQKMTDAKLKKCPACGKMGLQRKIGSGAGIVFHGNGFYCTDFKNKTQPPTKTSPATAK